MPNRIAIDDLKICRITCTGGVFPEDIIAHIEALDIDDGFSNSMISKLDNAIEALEKDQGGAAVNKLGALMNELEAQSGKKISEEDADALINMALLAIENIEGNIL